VEAWAARTGGGDGVAQGCIVFGRKGHDSFCAVGGPVGEEAVAGEIQWAAAVDCDESLVAHREALFVGVRE